VAASRIIGIAIVGIIFYLTNRWVYFMIVQVALTLVFLFFFIRQAYESPLQIMVSTADHDMCKYVLNSIAITNEEEIVREKLAFSLTPAEIFPRRTFLSLMKNVFNHRVKLATIGLLSLSWLAYATA
jgi:ABC-type siderophore export system fused ATPase/permease subunit